MEVQFDRNRRRINNPQTRIFSPTQTGTPTPVLEDASMPVRPQPRAETKQKSKVKTVLRITTASKVLILLSVFTIAATALVALFGAAEYAKIISDTASVRSEIDTYNEQISQLRKSQSSMNDFATINEVCRSRGMTMNWYKGEDQNATPAGTAGATETNAPATPGPATQAPEETGENGD